MLDLRQHVGGEQYGTLPAQLDDESPDLDSLIRIEPFRGLVQHQKIGPVEDGGREPGPLPEPFG